MMQNLEWRILAQLRIWVFRIAIVAPGCILAAAAAPRLISGLAVEHAFPVPFFMNANDPLPALAYQQAREALARANSSDGQAKIAEAEAAYLGGSPARDVLPILKSALDHAPSSARGWTLLAELEVSQEPKNGAAAVGLALQLAPYDYWLAARRANVGAGLWNALDIDQRDLVLRQTRLLWSEEQLRGSLGTLFASQDGAALVGRAFAEDPDILRELNRRAMRDSLRNLITPP